MNDHLSNEANPQTRGSTPVQFFESAGPIPAIGTKATPRPADRPRQGPLLDSGPVAWQVFSSEPSDICGCNAATISGQEGTDPSAPPSAPADLEPKPDR
jgi:hypothetical protein